MVWGETQMVWAWLGGDADGVGGDADGVGLVRGRRRWCGPG